MYEVTVGIGGYKYMTTESKEIYCGQCEVSKMMRVVKSVQYKNSCIRRMEMKKFNINEEFETLKDSGNRFYVFGLIGVLIAVFYRSVFARDRG